MLFSVDDHAYRIVVGHSVVRKMGCKHKAELCRRRLRRVRARPPPAAGMVLYWVDVRHQCGQSVHADPLAAAPDEADQIHPLLGACTGHEGIRSWLFVFLGVARDTRISPEACAGVACLRSKSCIERAVCCSFFRFSFPFVRQHYLPSTWFFAHFPV